MRQIRCRKSQESAADALRDGPDRDPWIRKYERVPIISRNIDDQGAKERRWKPQRHGPKRQRSACKLNSRGRFHHWCIRARDESSQVDRRGRSHDLGHHPHPHAFASRAPNRNPTFVRAYIPRRFKALSMSLSALDLPPWLPSLGPSISLTLIPGLDDPFAALLVSRGGAGGGVRPESYVAGRT